MLSLNYERHRHDKGDHEYANECDADEVAVDVRVVRCYVVLPMVARDGAASCSARARGFHRVSASSWLDDLSSLSSRRFSLNACDGAG